MNLLRSLADAGKTVVCITHSLANVERTCHLVVILTAGGKLAFVGKPAEALSYFEIDRLGDVYDRLAEKPAEHWQEAFLKSPHWLRYVTERLPAETTTQPTVPLPVPRRAAGGLRLFLRQTVVLTRRYAAIWRGDYLSLLAMAGQALVVAVLLGVLFGDLDRFKDSLDKYAPRSVNLLFLLAVSSFWFGCNNAAKEIVKERTIYTRERDFNMLVGSYYASKLLLLTLCSWLQTVLLYGIVRAWCGPPGPFADELIVLLALALAGVALGLAISAVAATEEMAVTLIPISIIPQIILSGAIAPLEGLSKVLALAVVATYWGKGGLDNCLPEDVTKAVPGVEPHSPLIAVLVLLGHTVGCIAAALIVLHWQNRRRRGLAALLGRAPR
jgi:ABC-type multidrug transport system permease subunit